MKMLIVLLKQEIENLKYAHAEAVRKLKFYENTGGGGSRGGRSS